LNHTLLITGQHYPYKKKQHMRNGRANSTAVNQEWIAKTNNKGWIH